MDGEKEKSAVWRPEQDGGQIKHHITHWNDCPSQRGGIL
jgi:hypothetical protein